MSLIRKPHSYLKQQKLDRLWQIIDHLPGCSEEEIRQIYYRSSREPKNSNQLFRIQSELLTLCVDDRIYEEDQRYYIKGYDLTA